VVTEHTRPRIYGTDCDDAASYATRPSREYVELNGGPLLDVTGLTTPERTTGAFLITPHSAYGPGGRALYAPDFSSPVGQWVREGDMP